MQNPIRLIARFLFLLLQGRLRWGDPSRLIDITDNGEIFHAFRRVDISRRPDQQDYHGCILKVRFTFRNLSIETNKKLSLIPIPLIVAQPGFRSKTWYLGSKSNDFIGYYEFDSIREAKAYQNSLPIRIMGKRALPGSLVFHLSESVSTRTNKDRGEPHAS